MASQLEQKTEHFHLASEDALAILKEALSTGAEFSDIFSERRVASSIVLEDDIIKSAGKSIAQGTGVRSVKEDQVGYAFSDEGTVAGLLRAAKTAAAIASDPTSRVQTVQIGAINPTKRYPIISSGEIDLQQKLTLVKEANAAARDYDSRILKVSVSISDETRDLEYFSSEGVTWKDSQPMILLRVSCIAEENGKRQNGSDSGGGRFGLEYFTKIRSASEIAREAARIAILNLEAKDAPAGLMTVVLGPADSGVLLHEAVGHGLEADFNRKQLSNYSEKIGQKVASEHCTVIDEGLFDNMRGSINVDDEGNLPTSALLIEKGILRGYINDKISARILKVPETGNGRRESYRHVPMPRMTNTYMQAGEHHPDEILGSVKKGIYAKRFGGGQVDITKGDFVFTVLESYMIEDGKITHPLKGVTLIGNGPDVMNKITMVGNDLKFTDGGWTCGKDGQSVPVGMGIPTCRVSEITVGGSKL